MPITEIIFYCEDGESVPVLNWLRRLRGIDRRGFAKCAAKLSRLAALGHELRRPECDYLRDGVYELRARSGHVNYRILYFFFGEAACILAHALTKEDKVPASDIDKALARKLRFESDPGRHSYYE